ncbi:MAG: hypothetical protein WCJ74_02745 [bacterium]
MSSLRDFGGMFNIIYSDKQCVILFSLFDKKYSLRNEGFLWFLARMLMLIEVKLERQQAEQVGF